MPVLFVVFAQLVSYWFRSPDKPAPAPNHDAILGEWDAILRALDAGATWVAVPQHGVRMRISRAGLARVHHIVQPGYAHGPDNALVAESPAIVDKIEAAIEAAKKMVVPNDISKLDD